MGGIYMKQMFINLKLTVGFESNKVSNELDIKEHILREGKGARILI
jgi:hypothetical protein